jgi:gliding motility-associated-like protein
MKFISFIFFFFLSLVSLSQCLLPGFSLGNDTTLCPNQVLTLEIPNNYNSIEWQDGNNSSQYTISESGIYHVSSFMPGENLIVNGDFEQGNSGFSTQYILGSSTGGGNFGLLTNAGTYEIAISPSLAHNNFNFCTHDGNMMIVNSSGVPNTKIWCQTVMVSPNTDYTLTAEATNAINYPVVPQLKFTINNLQIGALFSTSNFECDWSQFAGYWNSGLTTSAEICITNNNLQEVGNDFALDNIRFIPTCVYSDTISVIYEQFDYTLIDSLSFCSSNPEYIVLHQKNENTSFNWNTGENNDSILPLQSGWYFIEIQTENSCLYFDSTYVEITTSPIADFTYEVLTENVPYELSFTNESSDGETYFWNFSNGNKITNEDYDVPNQMYTKMGNYTITLITYNGFCSDTIKKTISLKSELIIPNIFTPNGDQNNDFFEITNLNKDDFEIQIINRWGQLVFESDDINFKWDGNDKSGKALQDGVYFYSFFNFDAGGTKNSYQGNIQLIRD